MEETLCQAHVDWLGLTVRPPETVESHEESIWLREQMESVLNLPPIDWELDQRGWFGYAHRITLEHYGLVAFGGIAQRGTVHIELSGAGCALITDWERVQSWGLAHNAKITRVDVAHDDHEGQELTPTLARTWHEEGRFNSNGRPPSARFIDDCGSNEGKTLYVGKRKNGKVCRIYEKGKQLGDPVSPWVRTEVELRGQKRVIPWDVVTAPGQYLAGAYPCLAFLSEQQNKVHTLQKAADISLVRLVRCARNQYGALVNVLVFMHDGDTDGVVNALVKDSVPEKLRPYLDYLDYQAGPMHGEESPHEGP